MQTSAPRAAGPAAGSVLTGVVRAVRPKQWVKNVLVYAAPAAAGLAGNGPVMLRTTAALVGFIAVSSAIYLVNDVRDLEVDRAHPTKRHRPIASGQVPVPLAVAVAVAGFLVATLVCVRIGSWELFAVLATYALLNIGYSFGLKHVPLVELFILASGFVLRTLAGAVAVDVNVSSWFVIVVSAGALHVAVSKRMGELVRTQADGTEGRPVLAHYTRPQLREIRTVAIGVALAAYLLWAFDHAAGAAVPVVYEVSAVPFALALFRFAAAAQREADAESPEEILLRDRALLVYGAAWALLFGIGLWMGTP